MMQVMKRWCAVVLLVGLMMQGTIDAVSLNGTAGTSIYVPSLYVFSHNDYAYGFVYFDQGFGVTAGATMTIGIHPPVQGPIILSGTGRMILAENLYLAPSGEITGGGRIQTAPPAAGIEIAIIQNGGGVKVISHPYRIMNDLTWDGGGAILNIDSGTPAQTFNTQPGFIVQPGATLVMSNVDLVGWSYYAGLDYTPIRFVQNRQMFSTVLNTNCIFDHCNIITLLESRTTYSNCNMFIKDTHVQGRESTFNIKAPKVLPQNCSFDAGVNVTYTPTTRLYDLTFGLDSFAMEVFDQLNFDNCTFTTTVPLKFARGAVRCLGVVDFLSTATATSDRILQIGEQALSKRCDLDLLPGAKMVMHNMELRYDNQF